MDRRAFLKSLVIQTAIFAITKNAYGVLSEKPKKEIILTIDDGPRETMKNILEDLGPNQENPVIFYVIGGNLRNTSSRELAKKALKNGHLLGNHSYNHPDFSKINFETAKKEIERTEKIIEELHQEVKIPQTKKLFRFPFGEEDKKTKEYLQERGYSLQRWDTDSNDWKYYLKENRLSLASILLNCKEAKNEDIVLVHDLPITSKYLIPFLIYSGEYKLILP